jgi:hypothetical protein
VLWSGVDWRGTARRVSRGSGVENGKVRGTLMSEKGKCSLHSRADGSDSEAFMCL